MLLKSRVKQKMQAQCSNCRTFEQISLQFVVSEFKCVDIKIKIICNN